MNTKYEEVVMCEAPEEEGVIHIKVISLPYNDPVEFNVDEARRFGQKILSAADEIDKKRK